MATIADVGRGSSSPRSAAVEAAMTAVLVENWWAIGLRGVLGIVFGAMAFLGPGATMLSLSRARYDSGPTSIVPSSA
jgi:hypothetical protein